MLSQLHLQSLEVIDWIKSNKESICAAHKDMPICVVVRAYANRNCTSYVLILDWLNRILLLERVHVHHIYHLVWTIHEQKLFSSSLYIEFVDSCTQVLWHLMLELHLDLSSDFFALVSQHEFCQLLVTHIG